MAKKGGEFSLKKLLFGRINRKLVLTFLLIALLVSVISIICIMRFHKVALLFDELKNDVVPDVILLSDIDIHSTDVHLVLMEYMAHFGHAKQAIELKEEYEPAKNRAVKAAEKYYEQHKHIDDSGKKNAQKILDEVEAMNSAADEIVSLLVNAEKSYEAITKIEDDMFHPIYLALKKHIKEQRAIHLQELAKAEGQVSKAETRGVIIILISSLAIIIFAIITGILISNTISRPIRKLYTATEELEKGNFKVRVKIHTSDELQELGDAFNKTTEALQGMEEQRKQVDAAKTRFLSITSHELRSPMTPMRAQLQMLVKGQFGTMNEKQKQSAEIVLRNTERLDKIICDFLEISRIEAARLKFNFMKTDLHKHINKVVEEMKHFMPEKKITVTSNIGRLPVIECDPDRVMQVLRNLLNNAIKFSHDNGKIEVTAKAEKGFILFSIKDNGIGISKEAQARLFEPFYQAEGTMYRKYGGTGLGLAICRGIVESQEGKIWLKSEKGKGTTAYFTAPYKPVREIKPIRVLFSTKETTEKAIQEAFTEILGPIGAGEFDELKKKGLIKENLFKYVDELIQKGILDKKRGAEFKKEINKAFS